MNLTLTSVFLFSFSCVLGVPLYFDSKLLEQGDERISFIHHVTYREDDTLSSPTLTFLYFVPKLGADLNDGFQCRKGGRVVKVLDFLKPGKDEYIYELLNFTDRQTWSTALSSLWTKSGTLHRSFTYSQVNGKYKLNGLPGVEALANFVFSHTTHKLFMKLVNNRIASHLFSHLVAQKFNVL